MGLREISEMANVSIATVSRVLNNPNLVSQKTRDSVLKAVKELNYVNYKHLDSMNFITKKENTIGVIIPDVINSLFARILEGIIKKANEINLTVNLFLTHDSINEEQNAINKLVNSNVKGIIIIRSSQKFQDSLKTTLILEKVHIPYVLVHRDLYKRNASGIFLSNANAVYDSINLLISNSYKQIGFITGAQGNVNSDERLTGYAEALNNNDIEIDEDLIIHCSSDDQAYEGTLKLLEKKPKAIFCCSNQLTLRALRAVREKGLKPGQDIQLFSFIKLDPSNSDNQNISFVDHPIDAMGEKAVTILNNKFIGTKGLIREILDYEIVFR